MMKNNTFEHEKIEGMGIYLIDKYAIEKITLFAGTLNTP